MPSRTDALGRACSQRQVPVLPGDTIESLAERVLPEEHALYVETLGRIARGEIALPVESEQRTEV